MSRMALRLIGIAAGTACTLAACAATAQYYPPRPAAPAVPSYPAAPARRAAAAQRGPAQVAPPAGGEQGGPRLAPLVLPSLALQPITPVRPQLGQPAGSLVLPSAANGSVGSVIPNTSVSPLAPPVTSPFLSYQPVAGNGRQGGNGVANTYANSYASSYSNGYAISPAYGAESFGRPAAPMGAERMSEGPGGGGIIVANVLQPVLLFEPREYAAAPQPLPIFSLSATEVLGATPITPDSPVTATRGVGLEQHGYQMLSMSPIGLAPLNFGGTREGLALIPMTVLGYGPPGPDASFPGFVPSRILPWPGQGAGAAAGNRPPSQQPYGYFAAPYDTSELGLALNALSMLSGRMPSFPTAPQPPPTP